jgi:acetyltransferase-like isoleucine patch superfamily enzyme
MTAERPVARDPTTARRTGAAWRIGCTICAIAAGEALVCGVAALPAVIVWASVLKNAPEHELLRLALFGILAVPSYAIFALGLLIVSPLATRLAGTRTPPSLELRISDMAWPLMRWVRYMVSIHVVRMFAGTLYRGSPLWTFYLRLNGARIGRRVYVNTLFISDHNLLEIGDDVVIGADVHLSGHTVEGGLLKTAPVRIGRGVTIGIDSVIDIGVEIGTGCQVAAISFVPKHAHLEAGALYGGIPVRRIESAVRPGAMLDRGRA